MYSGRFGWLQRRSLVLLTICIISVIYLAWPADSPNIPNQFWTDFSPEVAENEFKLQDAKKKTQLSDFSMASSIDAPFIEGCQVPDGLQPRASAAFVVLARNTEIDGVIKSMMSMERHFNQWYNYPWVFLNDEPFSDEFKSAVKDYTTSSVEFGTIPRDDWEFRPEIDRDELREYIESQGDRRVMYGNKESYHKMCRFYSGAFYRHELVKKYDWYWRVEPNIDFYCDVTYDPFIEMQTRGKKYGFNVVIHELYYTIPGLFRETKAFIRKNNINVGNAWKLFVWDSKKVVGRGYDEYDGIDDRNEILREIETNLNIRKFLEKKGKSDQTVKDLNKNTDLIKRLFRRAKEKPTLYEDRSDREEYNLCHFWSNFEIARTDLFNSPLYEKYFDHLDQSGGFYKERWGDAAVHSLAIGMMVDLKDIHYFRDIGYRHSTLGHCPSNSPKGQLAYTESNAFSRMDPSKRDTSKHWLAPDRPKYAGVGCRCRCPPNIPDVENASGSCAWNWAEATADNFKAFETVDLADWESKINKMIDNYLDTGGQLGKSNIVDTILS